MAELIKCSLYLPTGSTIITELDKEFKFLPNFRVKELANNNATDAQTVDGIRFAIDSMWGWLFLDMYQCSRNHFGRLDGTSVYRTQAYNDSLPDATHDSQHCHTQAADVLLRGVQTFDEWIEWWERLCKLNHQIGAIGLYNGPDRVHIEIGSDRRYGATKFQVRDNR